MKYKLQINITIKLKIMKTYIKSIALILIFTIALILNPLISSAKWSHESTNLPGTVSDGTVIALGAVATVGVGVLVYVLIKKSKQKKELSNIYKINMPTISWDNQLNAMANTKDSVFTTQYTETTSSSSLLATPKNNFMQQVENVNRTIPVNVMISPLNTGINFAMKNINGVQVGVRIRF